MKFPTLSRERAGLHLWPGISRQTAAKRIERGTMEQEERLKLAAYLRETILEIEEYIYNLISTGLDGEKPDPKQQGDE